MTATSHDPTTNPRTGTGTGDSTAADTATADSTNNATTTDTVHRTTVDTHAVGDAIEIRIVEEHEVEDWQRAVRTGFLHPFVSGEAAATWTRENFDPGRFLGAWDGERCVGTFRSLPMELTVPGGATLTADGVSYVTVISTHRRRGLLTRMMVRDLNLARERGDPVAILIAAEHRIYGRFGFGRAARYGGWTIDVVRSGGLRSGVGEPRDGARIDLITMAEVGTLGPELHERLRVTQPGAITRAPSFWRYGADHAVGPGKTLTPPFAAVHRDASGQVTGLLTYRVNDTFTDGDPDVTLTVVDHLATDPAAAAALWRYAFAIDWVRHVAVPNLAPDDPLPLWLVNPRAATRTGDQSEDLWLRVLDAPRAFAARTYDVPGRTILDVRDGLGYVAGRWLLETTADGTGTLSPTMAEPELALDADALGAVYLGGVTVPQLAAAGLVEELRPGAAARAGLQLRTALAPWCADTF